MSGTGERKLEFRIGVGNVRYIAQSSSDIRAGTWTHVAATYDGQTMKLYINGQVNGNHTMIAGAIQDNDNSMYIGKSQYYERFFNGMIDEVYVYDDALNAEEISYLCNFGL